MDTRLGPTPLDSDLILRGLLSSLSLMVGVLEITDDTLSPVFENPIAQRFFSAPSTDAAHLRRLAWPADIIALWLTHCETCVQTHQPVQFEYQHPTPTDSCYLAVTLQLVPKSLEHPQHFLYVAEDVSERRRRDREAETIADFSHILRAATTRAEMVTLIAEYVHATFTAGGVLLAFVDKVNGDVLLEAGHGIGATFAGKRLAWGAGIIGQVITTGQSYLTATSQTDPRALWMEFAEGVNAVACLPLTIQEETVGALWVGRATALTSEEIHILPAIANIAANAVHRISLHETTRRRFYHLKALRAIDMAIANNLDLRHLLNIFLSEVVAQLLVDAADVLWLDPGTQTLKYVGGIGLSDAASEQIALPLETEAIRQIMREQKQVYWSTAPELATRLGRPALQAENFTAYCGVPLLVKETTIGVLEIFHRAPLEPDADWFDFLETLAGQGAIAMDSAALREALHHSNLELLMAYDATIEGWSRALDLRDHETEGHTQRVTELTIWLARALDVPEAEQVHIYRGALLHDIGKMGIPDGILLKAGPLNAEELAVMRRHPDYAYQMLSPINYLRPALDIPYCHHEKWDGTGYPRGLKGDQIPRAARLFSVVDVWDALSSDRPYRRAWPKARVREHLRGLSGKDFEPGIVDAFLKMMDEM